LAATGVARAGAAFAFGSLWADGDSDKGADLGAANAADVRKSSVITAHAAPVIPAGLIVMACPLRRL